MNISQRDSQIVRAVARFGQLTAAHIHALCFAGLASRTPADRAVKRLVAAGVLARVERQRLVGGSQGGAGQYVYQLGRRGFQLFNEGEYRATRTIRYHQLLLADSYLAICQWAREAGATIQQASTGEDAWHKFGDIEIRPDMRLDLSYMNGTPRYIWLEVDMATEGKRQITDKLTRLWEAMKLTDPAEYPVAPQVVWVACDEERAKELRWIIAQGKDDGRRQYFSVCTLSTLSDVMAVHNSVVSSA